MTNKLFKSTLSLISLFLFGCTKIKPEVFSLFSEANKTPGYLQFLSGLPNVASNVALLNISCGGEEVVAYKYKLGPEASTDCSLETGYSSQKEINQLITENISSLPEGQIKICAVALSSKNQWQDFSQATNWTWTRDLTEPTVTQITVQESNGSYGGGQNLNLTVQLSENITTSGPVSGWRMNTGSDALFLYASGDKLYFSYTVNIGDNTNDFDYNSDGSLNTAFASAQIKDTAGNNANLNLSFPGSVNSISNSRAIIIDTIAPVLSSPNLSGITLNSGIAYYKSLTAAPPVTWTSATDTGSGVASYYLSIDESANGQSVVSWINLGNSLTYINTSLSLSDLTSYRIRLKAYDYAGNESNIQEAIWTTDVSPPSLTNFKDGEIEFIEGRTPKAKWDAATDAGVGLSTTPYEVGVGTTSGGDDKYMYAAYSLQDFYATGLELDRGQTYYTNLRVCDRLNNCTLVLGDGWLSAKPLWITDAQVNTAVKDGNKLYMGGEFTKVGPPTGASGCIHPASGKVCTNFKYWKRFMNGNTQGIIYKAISDGQGGWFVGGAFTTYGTSSCTSLARIDDQGNLVSCLTGTTNNSIKSLYYSSPYLYVGGSFTTIGGNAESRLVRYDVSSGFSLDLTWPSAQPTNGEVTALNGDGSFIYVGGTFSSPAARLMRLDISAGARDTIWNPAPNNSIRDLEISGTKLFVAGAFSTISGVSTANIKCLALYSLSASPPFLDTTFNAGFGASMASCTEVSDLHLDGTYLYAGGNFTNVHTAGRNYIVKLDQITGMLDTTWSANTSGYILSVTGDSDSIFFAGRFTQVKSQANFMLAAVNKTNGDPQSTFTFERIFDSDATTKNFFTVAYSSGQLYVGSSPQHVSIGAVMRGKAAAFDMAAGALTDWDPAIKGTSGYSGIVSSLAVSTDKIFVGGNFNETQTQARISAAIYNKTDGTLDTWHPDLYYNLDPTIAAVDSIHVDSERIYFGGLFNRSGGSPFVNLISFNTSSWPPSSTPPPINHTVTGRVQAIKKIDNFIYVSGDMTNIAGTPVNRFARYNVSSGTPVLDTVYSPNFDDPIFDMLFDGFGNIFTAGQYTQVNGFSGSPYASALNINGANYGAWQPSPDGNVNSLSIDEEYIYLGGDFLNVGAAPRNRLARVSRDPSSSATLDSWNPSLTRFSGGSPTVKKIIDFGSTVAVFGQFDQNGTTPKSCSIQNVGVFNKYNGNNSY